MDLALALTALLLTPGPSNTLMLLAGVERGARGAVRLIPVELAGYLASVVPLALVGQSMMDAWPGLRAAVTLLAAVWVAVLAARLWRVRVVGQTGTVTGKALFVTTLLNPKALIFGLVLLPDPDRLAQNIGLFSGLVVAGALFWAGLGAMLRGRTDHKPHAVLPLRRLASLALAAMSVLLLARGVGALSA